MIIDAFPFYNELGLAKLRMETLKDIVDRFVLVEMGVTHSGVRKGFVFEEFLDQMPVPRDRIEYVKVFDWPAIDPRLEEERWVLEAYQRDQIKIGLDRLGCSDDDIVLISDVDEIPDPLAIGPALAELSHKPFVVFCQVYRKHFINCTAREFTDMPYWLGTVGCTVGRLRATGATKCRRGDADRAAFMWGGGMRDDTGYIQRGGWHYTYFGGVEAVEVKVESIVEGLNAHQATRFSVPQRTRHNYRDGRSQAVVDWLQRSRVDVLPVEPYSTGLCRYIPTPVLRSPQTWEWLWWFSNTID
jgi:beta-1,4-mannosyl-glycoprotein beta-1,4-N-acetylglucosaminyltransferase